MEALGALFNLADCQDNKVPIASSERMLEILRDIIVSDKGEARVEAIGIIWILAVASANTDLITRPSLGIVAVLLAVLSQEKSGKARENTIGALSNLGITTLPFQ